MSTSARFASASRAAVSAGFRTPTRRSRSSRAPTRTAKAVADLEPEPLGGRAFEERGTGGGEEAGEVLAGGERAAEVAAKRRLAPRIEAEEAQDRGGAGDRPAVGGRCRCGCLRWRENDEVLDDRRGGAEARNLVGAGAQAGEERLVEAVRVAGDLVGRGAGGGVGRHHEGAPGALVGEVDRHDDGDAQRHAGERQPELRRMAQVIAAAGAPEKAQAGLSTASSVRPPTTVSVPAKATLDQPAVIEGEDAVGDPHDLGTVGHHEHGLAGPAGEPVEELEHLEPGLEVEIAGRFVGEDERRIGGEGARDGDPLLLAAREPVGKLPAAVGETDLLEQRQRPIAVCAARPPGELERQQQVLLDGEGRHEVEELEDEADAVPPRHGPLVFAEAPELAPLEQHLAGSRQVDAGDEIQQRRLPRPAPAEEDDQLPRRDRARNPIQHDARPSRLDKAPPHLAQFDDGNRIGHLLTLRQRPRFR